MKIHKEIIWNKGVNPKQDGYYLLALFHDDSLSYVSNIEYTVAHGWNTCSHTTEYGFGQHPRNGTYAWAELPFLSENEFRV